MKRKKIIISILLTLLTIIILLVVFRERIILNFIFKDIHPREPKILTETTYRIGWWAHQENLKIDSFTVEIIESKPNLFNSLSLLKYRVVGKLSADNEWEPYIKKIHLNERFLKQDEKALFPNFDNDSIEKPEAIIEITPIVDVKKNVKYKGEEILFEISNEIEIESFHWGNNRIRFLCDTIRKDLLITQRK
jgi:hypothetical protein